MGFCLRIMWMDGDLTWQQIWGVATNIITSSGSDFRKAVKEANPEALILAEHYGRSGRMAAGRRVGYLL